MEGQTVDTGQKERLMVHLDVCGAAYDAKALVPGPRKGSLVSLQVFCTPEFQIIPNDMSGLEHKCLLLGYLRGGNSVSLQPKSTRHFRCYHRQDNSVLEVSPLATYVDRNKHLMRIEP